MKQNPGVTIQVTGGGSGTGIAALVNGTTDICKSSRPMKDKEKDDVKAKRNATVVAEEVIFMVRGEDVRHVRTHPPPKAS